MQKKLKPSLLTPPHAFKPLALKSQTLNTSVLNTSPIFKGKQQGATLIVVLIVLILITSIGIIAVKNSNTGLKISTAEQVEAIKFRSNDSGFMQVEKADRENASDSSLDDLKGYVTSASVKYGEEVILCAKASTNSFFKLDEITVKTADGLVYLDRSNGFCDPSNPKHYISEGRVIRQSTFVKKVSDIIWSEELKQTESDDMAPSGGKDEYKPTCVTITSYITSLIPAVSDASNADIAECLQKGYSEDTEVTVDSCLDDLGVTYETQVQEYKNSPLGYSCL